YYVFFFSSRRRHTRSLRDWSSDVCSSDLPYLLLIPGIRNQASTIETSDRRLLTSESWYRRWVSPFGNPRIKAPSQLPAAYRSVARPSSPLSAKASTKRP